MKKASYLLFAGFLLLSGCSHREAAPSESSYFIGSWKLNSPVAVEANPLQAVVTFHKEGALTLNVQVEGVPQPERRWNFDEHEDELQLFLPSPERYTLVEKTKDKFTAKNRVNGSMLLFSRQ